MAYIETSAKTADNVESAFGILIECIFFLSKLLIIIEIYAIKKTINEELIVTNPEHPKESKNTPLPKT